MNGPQPTIVTMLADNVARNPSLRSRWTLEALNGPGIEATICLLHPARVDLAPRACTLGAGTRTQT
jgi:hypothetical protein